MNITKKEILATITLAFLTACISTSATWRHYNPPQAIQAVSEELTPTPTPTTIKHDRAYYEAEPLRYLRFRGEELGLAEAEITRFITVFTRCENKTLNPEAINQNTDKHRSLDVGVTQINTYWHRDRVTLIDMLDPVKNIDFAYTLYQEQGLKPWTCARLLGYIE